MKPEIPLTPEDTAIINARCGRIAMALGVRHSATKDVTEAQLLELRALIKGINADYREGE